MTECPKCKGYGIVGSAVPDILRGRGHIFSSIECPQCHGSGEVEMTNEEYIKSLNTEQLAEWINNIVDDGIIKAWMIKNNCCGDYLESVKWWLKQPHTNEE